MKKTHFHFSLFFSSPSSLLLFHLSPSNNKEKTPWAAPQSSSTRRPSGRPRSRRPPRRGRRCVFRVVDGHLHRSIVFFVDCFFLSVHRLAWSLFPLLSDYESTSLRPSRSSLAPGSGEKTRKGVEGQRAMTILGQHQRQHRRF